MNILNKELPQQIINEAVRQDYKAQIDSLNMFINGVLKQSFYEEDIPFTLQTLNRLIKDENAIFELINEAYNTYIASVKFCPKEEKERIKQSFISIADRLKDNCVQLYNRWQNYPYKLTKQADESIVLSPKDVGAHIETLGIYVFSEKEKEYYKLITEAAEAINKVRDFEIINNLKEYSTKSKIDAVQNGQYCAIPSGLVYDVKMNRINPELMAKHGYSF